MRWIDRRAFLALAPAQVSWLGILASSAVFALAHDLWLAGFVAGVVYALLYRQYSNIWYPIIAHATTNLALAGWVLWTGAWQYW
jgi:CAAX prenyl protease-like protein